jgi:hypothetical protein
LPEITAKRSTAEGRRLSESKSFKRPRSVAKAQEKNFPPLLSSFTAEAHITLDAITPVFPPLLRREPTKTALYIRAEAQRSNTLPPQEQFFGKHLSLVRSEDMYGKVNYTFIFSLLETLDHLMQQALQTAIRADAVFTHRCGFTESDGAIIELYLEDAATARNLLTELGSILKINSETSLLPNHHCHKLSI